MTRMFAALVAGGMLLAATPASAAVVDVTFSGVFDTLSTNCTPFSPPSATNCAQSTIATAFSGAFSYSTDPIPVSSSSTLTYFQIGGASLTSAAFPTVGRATTLGSTGTAGTVTQTAANALLFQNILGSTTFTNFATITLAYPTSLALDPASPASLALAQSARLTFTTFGSPGGSGPALAGTVTSFVAAERVAAVPEPTTWLMLLTGVGVTGGALRRRRAAPALRASA